MQLASRSTVRSWEPIASSLLWSAFSEVRSSTVAFSPFGVAADFGCYPQNPVRAHQGRHHAGAARKRDRDHALPDFSENDADMLLETGLGRQLPAHEGFDLFRVGSLQPLNLKSSGRTNSRNETTADTG